MNGSDSNDRIELRKKIKKIIAAYIDQGYRVYSPMCEDNYRADSRSTQFHGKCVHVKQLCIN